MDFFVVGVCCTGRVVGSERVLCWSGGGEAAFCLGFAQTKVMILLRKIIRSARFARRPRLRRPRQAQLSVPPPPSLQIRCSPSPHLNQQQTPI